MVKYTSVFPQLILPGQTVSIMHSNDACVWFGTLHIYIDRKNDAGVYTQIDEISTTHPADPLNAVKYKPAKPGDYRVRFHQDCTPSGGSDTGVEYFTVAKIQPYIVLSVSSPPTGSLGYPIGETIRVSGNIKYLDTTVFPFEEKNVTGKMDVQVDVGGVTPAVVEATDGAFALTTQYDSLGVFVITAKSPSTEIYLGGSSVIPLIITVICPPGQMPMVGPSGLQCEQPLLLVFDPSVITMIREGETKLVTGRLSDFLNNPVPNRNIRFDVGYVNRSGQIGTYNATTDANGQFRFDVQLPAGTVVNPPLPELVSVKPTVQDSVQQFFPVTFVVYAEVMYCILIIDPVYPATPGDAITVKGHLKTLAGAGLALAPLTLTPGSVAGVATQRTTTKEAGYFEFQPITVPNVEGIATLCYVAFDGIPSTKTTPAYIKTAPIPVFVIIYKPTGSILPVSPNITYTSASFVQTGERVTVSGKMSYIKFNRTTGLPELFDAEPGEEIQVKIGAARKKTTTVPGGTFEVVTDPLTETTQIYVIYAGVKYNVPPPLPALVLVYKPVASILPNLYGFSYVSNQFIPAGERVDISGKLAYVKFNKDTGLPEQVAVPEGEPVKITIGSDVRNVKTLAGGSFQVMSLPLELGASEFIGSRTINIEYTGTKFTAPSPLPIVVVVYKNLTLTEIITGKQMTLKDYLIAGGIVAAGTVVVAGAVMAKEGK